MKDRIFFAVCFGFGLGVLLRSFFEINFYFTLFILVLSVIISLFCYFTKLKWAAVAAVFVIAVSIGILRFHAADKKVPEVAGESFVGIIVAEPDIRETNQKLTVKTESTKILVTTGFDTEYRYGDEIKFTGPLKRPENFITDTGKEFDYVNYLRKDGVLLLANYQEIKILSRGKGNPIREVLFAVKGKLLSAMNLAIAPPESLLMGGLILGERSAFPEEMRQNLVSTGTIHIVALSGYNVTIVAEWFMKLFSFLPKNFGSGTGIFAILLFVLLPGGASPAVGAGIMAALALFARATGRITNAGRALLLAGVVMILWNPYVLVFDVSFQLSFIATVAVIFFAPRIERYFMWVTDKFKLRDIVCVTVAAYIFVLPFILHKMGNLSLVALPANILILAFIPATMGLGFFTAFLGAIWFPLSVLFGFISTIFLKYELWVIDFFAKLPFASFAIPNFPLVVTLAIYAWFAYKLFGRDIKKFFASPAAPESSSLSLPN
mgnify:CR=1 FL=1